MSGDRPAQAHRYRSAAFGVAWRGLHNFFTNPAFLIPSILFPLFFYTAFAGGLSAVGNAPSFDYPPGYTAFQFVFVFLQSAAFGGVFTGFALAADFERGLGGRYMLAAPHRSAIVTGYMLAGLGRWLATGVLLTIVALATGMQVDGGAVDLFGLVGLGVLVNLTATLFSSGIALRFKSIQAGPLMQTPVFLILFLAPVYVPLGLLAGWIHAVASVNPVTAILNAARGFLAGDPLHSALAFGVAAGALALMSLWARSGLRRAESGV
jgi:ABC-2 type transport system permease protein